jgi:hypothetical protein
MFWLKPDADWTLMLPPLRHVHTNWAPGGIVGERTPSWLMITRCGAPDTLVHTTAWPVMASNCAGSNPWAVISACWPVLKAG